MRVFVTGASGFIGIPVAKELIGAGHKVLGMVRSDAGAASVKMAGAEVHRGSLQDLESLRSGARAADAVIHLAFIHDFSKFPDPAIANGLSQLGFPALPVFEINGCPNPFANPGDSTPYVIYTTDPGKALLTGKCSDVNRIKGPILRGLAARAPYFHNGAAQDLNQLVNFYNQRFQMNLTRQEKAELVAFLNSL